MLSGLLLIEKATKVSNKNEEAVSKRPFFIAMQWKSWWHFLYQLFFSSTILNKVFPWVSVPCICISSILNNQTLLRPCWSFMVNLSVCCVSSYKTESKIPMSSSAPLTILFAWIVYRFADFFEIWYTTFSSWQADGFTWQSEVPFHTPSILSQ